MTTKKFTLPFAGTSAMCCQCYLTEAIVGETFALLGANSRAWHPSLPSNVHLALCVGSYRFLHSVTFAGRIGIFTHYVSMQNQMLLEALSQDTRVIKKNVLRQKGCWPLTAKQWSLLAGDWQTLALHEHHE